MKILILNWRDPFHPLAGGAELSLLRHAEYWKSKGASIFWVGSSFPGGKKNQKINGISYKRFGNHYTVHFLAFFYYVLGKLGQFDFVVDSFHFVPFFTPLYMRGIKKIALINEPAKNTWFKNIIFPISLTGYILEPLFFVPYRKTRFMTSAPSIFNELVNSYRIPKGNITIVEHGYDKVNIGYQKKEKIPTLLFVSRISQDKGIEDAIDAIRVVKKRVKNVHFWIAGKAENKEYLSKIEEKISDYKLNNTVKLWGFVPEKMKFDLMSKAWVLIHPSVREGWGLNVIEANSVGTPAIGYNVTGLRDSIKDNVTGVLVKDNNPSHLANEIINLIKDDKKRSSLSKNAKEWSKRFDWESAGSKSWKLIDKIVKNS